MIFFPVYAADYDAQSTILMFDACESLVCLPVLIVDDDELDKADRESIIVSLERTADLDNRIILDGVRGVIEIEDDEGGLNMTAIYFFCIMWVKGKLLSSIGSYLTWYVL